MKKNVDQSAYYNAVHQARLEQYRTNPSLLCGPISLPMAYFKPNQIIDRVIRAHVGNNFSGRTLLELGCGEGYWSCWFASQGAAVTSNDVSEVNVRIAEIHANANGLTVDGVVASCTDTRLPSESFDVILGAALVHHLTLCEEEALYGEVWRLLKPGGLVVFMESLQNSAWLEYVRTLIPIRDSIDPRPSRWSKEWKEYEANDPHPLRPNTTRHYRETLARFAFSRVTLEELGIFSRLDRLFRRWPWIQRAVHEADYAIKPFIPGSGKMCRNLIIAAWK